MGTTCRRHIEEDDKEQPEDEMSMLGAEECDDNSMLELNSVDAKHTYRSAVTIKVGKHINLVKASSNYLPMSFLYIYI